LPLRPCLACDIDGVIADTRPLVLQAYEEVGIDPARVQWGKPWHEWLEDVVGDFSRAMDVHQRKNDAYDRLVEEGGLVELSATSALHTLHGEYDIRFLTGASPHAARAVLKAMGFHAPLFLGTGCTTALKAETLMRYAPYGAYLDDNVELGEWIGRVSGWAFLSYDPRLTADDVVAQVRAALMGDDAWTQ
jgi:hypothetical protein